MEISFPHQLLSMDQPLSIYYVLHVKSRNNNLWCDWHKYILVCQSCQCQQKKELPPPLKFTVMWRTTELSCGDGWSQNRREWKSMSPLGKNQVYLPWNGKINTLIWQIFGLTLNTFRSAVSLLNASQLFKWKPSYGKKRSVTLNIAAEIT